MNKSIFVGMVLGTLIVSLAASAVLTKSIGQQVSASPYGDIIDENICGFNQLDHLGLCSSATMLLTMENNLDTLIRV